MIKTGFVIELANNTLCRIANHDIANGHPEHVALNNAQKHLQRLIADEEGFNKRLATMITNVLIYEITHDMSHLRS